MCGVQGGFAHCYELIDSETGTIYAGKIVPKASLTKPHQRDKVMPQHSCLHIMSPSVSPPPPPPFSDGNGDRHTSVIESCQHCWIPWIFRGQEPRIHSLGAV